MQGLSDKLVSRVETCSEILRSDEPSSQFLVIYPDIETLHAFCVHAPTKAVFQFVYPAEKKGRGLTEKN